MPPPEARWRSSKKQYNPENLTRSQPHLKYCTLKVNARASIEYACFSYEICCMQGCCASYYSLRTIQWQYWSPIIFCAILIYFLSQYCMGADKKRNRALELGPQQDRRRGFLAQNVVPGSVSGNPSAPLEDVENVNVDEFLEELIIEYRARYPDIECSVERNALPFHPPKAIGPPCYVDALHMPKPEKKKLNLESSSSTSRNHHAQGDDALPTYEKAVSR